MDRSSFSSKKWEFICNIVVSMESKMAGGHVVANRLARVHGCHANRHARAHCCHANRPVAMPTGQGPTLIGYG